MLNWYKHVENGVFYLLKTVSAVFDAEI